MNQSKIVIKEKFFAFLKKYKCYRKWLKYTIIRGHNIEDFLHTVGPRSYLYSAFVFADVNGNGKDSMEDHDYWNKIHDLWLKELEKDPSE